MKKNTCKLLRIKFGVLFFLSLFVCPLYGQTISTIVGNGTAGYNGDGIAATAAMIYGPFGVLTDNSGNIYFVDEDNSRIRKINTSGIITTIAGNGTPSFAGDGGPATAAEFSNATMLAMDGSGNLFFSDQGNNRVREIIAIAGAITQINTIVTVAGTGFIGFAGDGGPATAAEFNYPEGLAFDGAGNLYVADLFNNRVRMINTSGYISTIAGGGTSGLGDGGPATVAELSSDIGICFDGSGNLIIADRGNSRIRKITAISGVITPVDTISTIAGNGTPGYTGDDGPATTAEINNPYGVCVDACGNLLFTDESESVVRKVNVLGTITTYAGDGLPFYGGDGGLATAAKFVSPYGITIDNSGNIYVTDWFNDRIRKITGVTAAPTFTHGSSFTQTICENVIAYNINSLLTISDTYLGNAEYWTLVSGPSHGTLAGLPYSSTYTGGTLTPVGLSYTPTGGYSGSDAFQVEITDCGVTKTIAINITITPTNISGILTLCAGLTTSLTDATSGGTWTSGNTSIATVGIGSGIVSGVTAGTSIITYTSPGGCTATTAVTVNITPPAIAGTKSVCAGYTTTLSDAVTGGTWSSANTSIATISSGAVTGISAGTSTITYSIGGCFAITTVTVTLSPAAITGTLTVCRGHTTTLSDAIAGGTWTSGNTGIATVGSGTGVVTGVNIGTATITYAIGSCYVAAVVTVALPPATISGALTVCAGYTTTLSDGMTGGAWSSGSTGIATIDATSGIVTGISGGTATITYTIGSCFTTVTLTVNPLAPISGSPVVCVGLTIALSDAATGGTWSSGNTAVATIGSGTGIVSGITTGTAIISYLLSTGCMATTITTVNSSIAGITGTTSICIGSGATLHDLSGGGTWTSSNTAVATIDPSTGAVTSVTTGTTTITYMLSAGCFAATTVIIDPVPSAINGPSTVCAGSLIVLTDALTGGTWTSLSTTVSVTPGGTVYGVSPGTATITYTTTGSCAANTTLTINPSPTAIAGGTTTVCPGVTYTVSDATSSGTWTSSNSSVVTIDPSSGFVTAIAGGTSTISYTIGDGCAATKIVAVYPTSQIVGLHDVCAYSPDFYVHDVDSPGVWTCWPITITAIPSSPSGTGLVHVHGPGTDTINFYNVATGCSVLDTFTVWPVPGGILPLIWSVCTGATLSLSDPSAGGTWTSSNTGIATIGSATGIATGLSSGTANISYTFTSTGCGIGETISVDPIPTISGTKTTCLGYTTTLSDAVSGGIWSSTSGTISVVGSTGIVTGLSAGTGSVTYTAPGGCRAMVTVTVLTLPSAIMGPDFVCPSSSITLSDATSGGTWTSSITTVATAEPLTGIITGVSAGTSMISYTSLATGCFMTYSVQVEGATCTPCATFGGSFTILSGTITSSLPSGNYYVPHDIGIGAGVTISNAVVMIAPGVTIGIGAGGELALDHCHLFGCNMWQGIVLNSGGSSSGRLYVTNGSMIEDANTAVLIMNPVTPGGGYIFYSDNAIFNRNYFGVDIENYNDPTTYTYPFLIRNTVFCSRYFQGSFPTYPAAWPTTTGLYGLKTPYAPSDLFQPPFNIDNPNPSAAASGTPYAPAPCWNGSLPYCGIYLAHIGSTTLTSSIGGSAYIPATYSEIVIGDVTGTDDNSNQNLFDHTLVGIYANTANASVINNAFINMVADSRAYYWPVVAPPSGDGVYAISTDDALHQQRLRVYTPSGSTYKNWFYKFLNGVESYNYYQLVGQNTYMINKPAVRSFYTPAAPSGQYGYRISATHYDTIDISSNIIYNVNTGIGMWATTNYYYGNVIPYGMTVDQFTGECQILNNTIQASPYGYSSGMAEAVQTGIAVQNVISTPSSGVWAVSTSYLNNLNVDGNHINDAYNGIYVNNFYAQPGTSNSNNISVRTWPGRHLQFGINHTLCKGSTIYSNYITTSTGTQSNDSIRAIYAANNTAVNVACNTEQYTGRGYEFFLNNMAATWRNNTMQNNIKGMVLNGGLIGPQGSSTTSLQNEWLGSWGSGDTQTYVFNGANAAYNKLYVKSSPAYSPTVNAGRPFLDRYDASSGSIVNITPVVTTTCPVPPPIGESLGLYEAMVRQDIVYANNPISRNWVGQFELWKAMQVDTTLQDSSAVLHVFDSMAANSRYSYLTNIAAQILLGNFDSATTMLGYNIDSMANVDTDTTTGVRMADNIDADNIVGNYQAFYGLYIKYVNTILTGSDSLSILALAQLCPERNGTVVYQARALYSFIYNDLSMFNDDSCLNADTTYIADRRSNGQTSPPTIADITGSTQQYQLYPNPNNGNFVIQQFVQDHNPVTAEIYDVVGRSVYKETLLFISTTTNLRLGTIVPGVYLMELKDNNGRLFRFEFAVN